MGRPIKEPIYTGRFSIEQIARVLAAIGPITQKYVDAPEPKRRTKLSVPRQTAVVMWLELTAARLETMTPRYSPELKGISPSELKKRFHAIGAAANELLDALGIGRSASKREMKSQIRRELLAQSALSRTPDRNIDLNALDKSLSEHIAAIIELRNWALQGEEEPFTSQHRRLPDPTTDALRDILDIWETVLARKITAGSVDPFSFSNEVSGAIIEFTQACLEALGLPSISPKALRARIRRFKAGARRDKTRNGLLREIWRRDI